MCWSLDQEMVEIMRCKDVTVPQPDEARIKCLHSWIAKLCNPEINFCQDLVETFVTTCESAIEQDYDGGRGKYTHLADKKLVTVPFSNSQAKDGPVYSKNPDGSIIEGSYKKGVPHGYFRHINAYGDIELFCCFIRGIMHGPCWKGLPGGGFLVSDSWTFTSEEMIFLYPDCRTALYGSFYKGQMVKGQLCQLLSGAGHCSYFCGVFKLAVTQPEGEVYSYDPSTSTRINSQPYLPDPYEIEFVEVGPSTIPKAGEGLFAKIDIDSGTVISFYNGVREEALDEELNNIAAFNYRIALDEELDLNIPDDMTLTSQYNATLGHKVCHSFTPNTEFETFYHPRFGTIKCLISLKEIDEGEEIFINYKYNLSHSPNWYKVSWAKHQKHVRKLPDWKLKLMLTDAFSPSS